MRYLVFFAVLAGGCTWTTLASAEGPAPLDSAAEELRLGTQLPALSVLPFAGMLAAIALLPLAAGHWWEKNRNKFLVSLVLGLPVAAYLIVGWQQEGLHELAHTAREYLSFIILLAALFVASGGIHVRGSLAGTPAVNTFMLGCGAVLANFVGTTGASMLLVRPMLKANHARRQQAHVFVFFIFIVSNCGGVLTPLGDPPLFLGFLNGVPFGWTLRLWPQWLLVNASLLVIFNVWDRVLLAREERQRPASHLEQAIHEHEPLRIEGLHNLLLLAGIVVVIYSAGTGLGNAGQAWPFGVQEVLMLALAAASWFTTSAALHQSNRFSFGPIVEVAVLFAGIFVTMTPALLILNVRGAALGIREPWQFFWASGGLSSFLDNAPTYLAFAATACGIHDVPLYGRYLATLLASPDAAGAAATLAAISCGAVFMGANSYIGNGPNFMVKAIAEEHGVRMPGFFGYILYSGAILLPLFALVTFVFFR
ncbi:MAG TPA: sodium:proton antiporter [Pirellulales bacterium]|jgi:Na+/H+ antiporter NhaD/arsenite permease-like protein|nr:sodium:proton antiporter [Pirellulales bacterium]